MKKVRNGFIKKLRYLCLAGVISLGFMTIVGSNGDGGNGPTPTPTTYIVSGQVTRNETGLSGVTITLSGDNSDTITTDSNGDYSFSGLSNGSYTVTPSMTGYTFDPTSRNVTISGSDAGGVDFSASIDLSEIGASWSDDNSSAVMGDTDGNIMVVKSDSIVWTAPNDESFVVYYGDDGFPTRAVSGGYVIIYENWTSNTVDIAIISPDGSYTIYPELSIDPDLISSLSVITASSIAIRALDLSAFNLATALEIGGKIVSVAQCGVGIYAAVQTGGLAWAGAVWGCRSTVLMIATALAGEDNALVEATGDTLTSVSLIGGCTDNAISCASALAGLAGTILEDSESTQEDLSTSITEAESVLAQAPETCTDNDFDGYYAESGCGTAVDCDDNDDSIYPGATEICDDSKDNDCDGATDCVDSDCSSDPTCQVGPFLTRITTSSREEDEPAWSPDGTQLVYCAYDVVDFDRENEWIWTINSNGGTPSKVSIDNAGSDEFCREPFWGPSGYIVFEAAWGTSTIYKVPSQGGNAITLAGPDDDNGNIRWADAPVWDWSGSDRIAFIAPTFYGSYNIYLINSNGTALTKLTDYATSDRRIYDVSFSPGGTELIYSRYNGELYDIWLLNIGSGTTTQLTENSGNNAMTSWSPDGTQIVFASDRDGDLDLYIMPISGGDVRRITTNIAFDGNPAWSPDGTRIAFTSDRSGTSAIWVISGF